MTHTSHPLYPLTEHNAYWANILRQDIAAGKTMQQAAHDVWLCVMMMGRGVDEANNIKAQAVYWSGLTA